MKGGRRQVRQRKRWEDNIKEWTGLEFGKSQRAVKNREKMEKTDCKSICGTPTTLVLKGLMMMMMVVVVVVMVVVVVAASALKDRALRTWQLSTKTPVLGDPGLVLRGSMLSHYQTASTQSLLVSKHSIFLPTLLMCMERKRLALRPQKPLRLIRDGEVGGSGILYLTPTRYTIATRIILH